MPELSLEKKLKIKHTPPTETKPKDQYVLMRHVHGANYVPLEMHFMSKEGERSPCPPLVNILQTNYIMEGASSEKTTALPPTKLLFEGDPGIGKSTTLKHILELYAEGKLEQFEHTFLIKLDLLLTPYWSSRYAKYIDMHPLACLVHASLEQVIHARGAPSDNLISTQEIIELFAKEDQSKTLFVVDGYDKIAHLIGERSIKDYIDQILEFDNVFMSARPNTMVPLIKNEFDNAIVIDGIASENIRLFIKKYFISQANILKNEVQIFFENHETEKTAESLFSSLKTSTSSRSLKASFQLTKIIKEHKGEIKQENLKQRIDDYYIDRTNRILKIAEENHAIKELLSNPMHASMICMQDINDLKTITLADLYRGVINRLGEQIIPINEAIKGEPIETLPELITLKKLAYVDLTQGGLSRQIVIETIEDNSDIDKLLSIGILESFSPVEDSVAPPLHRSNTYRSTRHFGERSSEILDMNYKFIDRSIAEYLAACAFKDILMLEKGSSEAKEAAEFIASHRHETKYLTFLKFIAKTLSDLDNEGQIAITRFWEAVTCTIHETVETGIDKPITLWMHLLSQVMINEALDSRIPNLSKIIDIIDKAILSDFIRWKSALESSGYLSHRILAFLEKQVNQQSRNKMMFATREDAKSQEEHALSTSNIKVKIDDGKEDEDGKAYAAERSKYHSTAPNMAMAQAAITTYSRLFHLIDNKRMFDNLFSNLSDLEDYQIIESTIIAISRIIRNHQLTNEQIKPFNEKLTVYSKDERLSSNALKAIQVIELEGQGLNKVLRRASSTTDNVSPAMKFSTSHDSLYNSQELTSPTKKGRPPLKHEDTKTTLTLRSPLNTVFENLQTYEKEEKQHTIKILIDHLQSNPTWLDEPWETRMIDILKIISYCNDKRNAPNNSQLKELTLVANKALQKHIKKVNDDSDMLWICSNFKELQRHAKSELNEVIESILYKVLSDNKITKEESKFVCLCIKELQISISIHPPKIVTDDGSYAIYYTIEYSGNTYTLHGLDNAAEIEEIIRTAVKKREKLPMLTNTGSGIKIAASELPAYSIVDRSKLSAENALVTFCYRTSHLLSKPTDVFILVERKGEYFGQHIVTKISVNNDGKIKISPDFNKHPDDIDASFLIQIFGAMQYTETEKIRYLTKSLKVNTIEAQNILSYAQEQAKSYAQKEATKMSTPHNTLTPKFFQSKSAKSKNLKQKEDIEPFSIEYKIDLLYSFIQNLEIDITGDWEQDVLDKNSGFTMHNRAIIDSIDAQHTLSMRIQVNENSAAIESFEKFIKSFNVDALTRVIAKEELTEHARIEMEAIEEDLYKYALYKTIVLKINAFYIAVNAINSEMVKNDKHGAAGKIGTLLGKLGPYVPLLGPVVEFIGELFTEADDVMAETRIETFLEIALNSQEMSEISDKIARKITRLDLNDIQPSVRSTLAAATETVSNLVNNGPAKIIVQACKSFKDNLEEKQLDGSERAKKTTEDQAKEHGEIIVKAIIESMFTKSYDPKIKVGTIKRGAEARVKKAYKNDNEFKASQIVNLIKEIYNLHNIDDQSHGERRNSLTGSENSAESSGEQVENEENQHHLEPAGDNHPPVETGSFGCGGGRSHCIVMAVSDIRYDPPNIQEAWETRNLGSIKDLKKSIIETDEKPFVINHDKLISLYADAQRLYSKDAVTEIYNYIKNDEEKTEQLLFVASIMGNKYVLKQLFGSSNEDNIKDFEAIIANEYEEGESIGGISQYIYNARFAENHILSSARGLIKYINNVYSEFQELLFNQEYGDRFLTLLEQLPFLLRYAEKGQPAMPLYRPPYRDPGDDDDYSGGGGSGSLFFERDNGRSEDQETINILYYDTHSLNETKVTKLLIKLSDMEDHHNTI
ncbi:MAG: NACHT domain-containing protein [Rickettsiales bacterium]|jgi:hypothetical protein|nr:NACHT domain-containing protein [Rickettsiales bacterium]